jgi:hypothetical protein
MEWSRPSDGFSTEPTENERLTAMNRIDRMGEDARHQGWAGVSRGCGE